MLMKKNIDFGICFRILMNARPFTKRQHNGYSQTVWQITTERCVNSSYFLSFLSSFFRLDIIMDTRHLLHIRNARKSQYCVCALTRTMNVMCVSGENIPREYALYRCLFLFLAISLAHSPLFVCIPCVYFHPFSVTLQFRIDLHTNVIAFVTTTRD